MKQYYQQRKRLNTLCLLPPSSILPQPPSITHTHTISQKKKHFQKKEQENVTLSLSFNSSKKSSVPDFIFPYAIWKEIFLSADLEGISNLRDF